MNGQAQASKKEGRGIWQRPLKYEIYSLVDPGNEGHRSISVLRRYARVPSSENLDSRNANDFPLKNICQNRRYYRCDKN